jgi:arylsulfatase A-like enzyme
VAEPAVMMDLFPTVLAAAGVASQAQRVIDGKDLVPLVNGRAMGHHEYVFGMQGPRLATVRDARWKLHVLPARDRQDGKPGERWIDPRGPDGVTILAPYEQAQPSAYPGLRGGDETKALTLFDLANDPGEQTDVSARNPEVVARLKTAYERAVKEMQADSAEPAKP